MAEPFLLAVDCGLRTGLALFDAGGRVLWYRSQNYGNRQRLKRGAFGLFKELPGLEYLVVEGGGDLAEIWERQAEKSSVPVRVVPAEAWRTVLMLPRNQRDGATAKLRADVLARRIIEWSGASAPTSLRHDAAEAVLVGFWGCQELGVVKHPPPLR